MLLVTHFEFCLQLLNLGPEAEGGDGANGAILSARLPNLSLERANPECFVAKNAVTLLATSSKTAVVIHIHYISEPAITIAALPEMHAVSGGVWPGKASLTRYALMVQALSS